MEVFGQRLDLMKHQADSDSRKPLTLQGGTFQATVLHHFTLLKGNTWFVKGTFSPFQALPLQTFTSYLERQ